MFTRLKLIGYLTYGIIAAVLYCIPMVFFVRSGNFEDIYLLYIGNALFLVGIVLYIVHYNNKRAQNGSTSSILIGGHITTGFGIVLALLLSLLLILIFVPGVLHSNADTVLQDANPSQPAEGKFRGILFILFMNTVIGNACTGAFVSILLPYTIKKDQTKDKASEFLNIRKEKVS
jgi:hypothetical protein